MIRVPHAVPMKSLISVLLMFPVLTWGTPADEQWMLHEGTPVRMKLGRTISSADATQGENLDFEILDGVQVNDVAVIPKGSIAIATVTEAQSKRRMGRGGKLNVNVDYVRLPTGEKLALRGVQDAKGGGHTGAMTGAMVATAIVFFPAAPLFLFMHGKDISIPKGHEVTVYTDTDYLVEPAKYRVSVPVPTQEKAKVTGAALTNDDVVKMKGAGFSDQLMVDKIKGSPGGYKLAVADLLELKKAGISDVVLSAMVGANN